MASGAADLCPRRARATPRLAAAVALAVALALATLAVVPPRPAAAQTRRETVAAAGDARLFGSTADLELNAALVDIAATPSGRGYWLLGGDGGVFGYGDAPFHGSTGGLPLNQPVRAMAPTPGALGYWFVAADGGVFAFGDARFYGSTGGMQLNQPVVGIAPTRTGKGYWLVAADGGVFAFGDAGFVGSLGGAALPDPIVAVTPMPGGTGYWLVDRAGRVYPFGDARDMGEATWAVPVSDIQATPSGNGYWVVRQSGDVEAWGDAAPLEPDVSLGPGQRVVGLASTPTGRGVWLATSGRHRLPTTANAAGPHRFLVTDALGRPQRWNPCAPVHWQLNPLGAPPGALELTREAFEYVRGITGLDLREGGLTDQPPGLHRRVDTIVVAWDPLLPSAGYGGTLGHQTPNGPKALSGWVQLSLLATSRGEPLAATWAADAWGPILLHEIGHVLGLDHVEDVEQLLYPEAFRRHDFNQGDLAGLHRLGAAAGCL